MWRLLLIGAGILTVLAIDGCGGGSDGDVGEVKTPEGTYRITKVELLDRYPSGCSDGCLIGPPGSSSSSNRLQDGTQLVAVSVEAVKGPARLGSRCPGETIYVVAEDGSRHTCTALGTKGGEESKLDLLFGVPKAAKGFTLHAPGTAAVELGK